MIVFTVCHCNYQIHKKCTEHSITFCNLFLWVSIPFQSLKHTSHTITIGYNENVLLQ